MDLLRHGYTNRSVSDGCVVVKTYLGPDCAARQDREDRALRSLAGVLPVPELLHSVPGTSTTAFVPGIPAQDAMNAGGAAEVLNACGRLLRLVQSVDPRLVYDDVGCDGGFVLVHNDFGPNNIVMQTNLSESRLLCDWEWVTIGNRNTDLGWAEFIVRYHHPESVLALSALFDGYGGKPSWGERQEAMALRAVTHRDFVRRWQGLERATTWDDRIAAITSWKQVC